MVNGDGADIDELGQIVFVGDLKKSVEGTQKHQRGGMYIIAMPGDNIEWTMVLRALEELASKLIDNLPRLLDNLIPSSGTQKVSRIGKSIGT